MKGSAKAFRKLLSMLIIAAMAITGFVPVYARVDTSVNFDASENSDGYETAPDLPELVDGSYYLYNVLDDGTITINGADSDLLVNSVVNARDGVLEIPAILDGRAVTEIGPDAFRGFTGIEKVVIPESVRFVGERAFMDISTLESFEVKGEGGYTSIGGVLFTADKYDLIAYPEARAGESYIIPNGTALIGCAAFADTVNLKSIVVPESVRYLGDNAFSYADSVENIYFLGRTPDMHGEVERFHDPEGANDVTINALFDDDSWDSYLNGDGNRYIDNGIEVNFARFNTEDIAHLYTNHEFTYVRVNDMGEWDENGEYAAVTGYIGDGGAIVIPEEIDGFAVKDLVWGDSDDNFFADNEAITEITLPGSMERISQPYVITDMPNLTAIHISDNDVFYEDNGVIYGTDGDGNKMLVLYPSGRTDAEYHVAEYTVTIGNHAFCGANNLKRVFMPESIAFIDFRAFQRCYNLRGVYFAGTSFVEIQEQAFRSGDIIENNEMVWNFDITGQVVFYICNNHNNVNHTHESGWVAGTWQFKNGINFASSSYTDVSGDFTYYLDEDNIVLTGIHDIYEADYRIPDTIDGRTVTQLGSCCIHGHEVLEQLFIPDSVKVIKSDAIIRNWNLHRVEARKLEAIERLAFHFNDNISDFVIPATVQSLDGYFTDSKSLNSYAVEWVENPAIYEIDGVVYTNIDGVKTLAAYPGGRTQLGYTVDSGTNVIGICAFGGNQYLTDVTLPNSVIEIKHGAFNGLKTGSDLDLVPALRVIFEGELPEIDRESFYYHNADGVEEAINTYFYYNAENSSWAAADEDADSVITVNDIRYNIIESSGMPIWDDGFGCRFEYYLDTDANTAVFISYVGDETFVTIPETINVDGTDYGVILSEMVFSGCDSITEFWSDNSNYYSDQGILYNNFDGNRGDTLIAYPSDRFAVAYVIPSGVTNIASYAFANGRSIESVVFPDDIHIGANAFISCDPIWGEPFKLIFGNGSYTFDEFAFDGMNKAPHFVFSDDSGLWDILPERVLLLDGSEADVRRDGYSFDSGYLYNTDNDEAYVNYYVGRDSELIIPDRLGGNTVAGILYQSAQGRDFITRIEFPEGLKFIEGDAFRFCDNLREIMLPATLEGFDSYAFYRSPVSSLYFRDTNDDGEGDNYNGYFTADNTLYRNIDDGKYELVYIPYGWGYMNNDDGNGTDDSWDEHRHWLDCLYQTHREMEVASNAYLGSLYITIINFEKNTVKLHQDAIAEARYDGNDGGYISMGFRGERPDFDGNPFNFGTDDVNIFVNSIYEQSWNIDGEGYIHVFDDELPKFRVGIETYDEWYFYTVNDDKIVVYSYNGTAENVEVPATLDHDGDESTAELLVAQFDYSTFAFNRTVKTIHFPATVEYISPTAFDNCSALTDVTVESGSVYYMSDAYGLHRLEDGNPVELVWSRAVRDDSGFLYVVDGENVTVCGYDGEPDENGYLEIPEAIGGKNCTAVQNGDYGYFTTFKIPRYVESIELHIFDDFDVEFERFEVAGENQWFTEIDGVLFKKDGDGNPTELVCFPPFKGEDFSYYVPHGTTSIGDFAFHDNRNLETVILPDTLANISGSAFENASRWFEEEIGEMIPLTIICTGDLFTVNGETVSKEDIYTLGNHGGLNIIVCNDENDEYQYDGNVLYTIENDQENSYAVIFRYVKYGEDTVVIPETLDGAPVNNIGSKSFEGAAITAVTLSEQIRKIGSCAFRNCYNLSTINLNDGLKSVDDAAFGSTAIEELVIPASLEEFDSNSLTETYSLTAIYVAEGESRFISYDGVLFEKLNDGEVKLVSYPSAKEVSEDRYEIPARIYDQYDVRVVGRYAFVFAGIRSAFIPYSVVHIENNAFDGSDIEWLNFNGDRPSFDSFAFEGVNTNELTLYYDNNGSAGWSTPYICVNSEGGEIWLKAQPVVVGEREDDYTYYVDTHGTDDSDDDTAVIIHYYGEAKDDGEEGLVRLPSTLGGKRVTGIEGRIFGDNGSVRKVIIPDTIEWIYDTAFDYAGNIGEYIVEGESRYYTADGVLYEHNVEGDDHFLVLKRYPANRAGEYFRDTQNAHEISSYAFGGALNLKDLRFGDNLRYIGESAFDMNNPVSSITFDGDAPTISENSIPERSEEFDVYIYCRRQYEGNFINTFIDGFGRNYTVIPTDFNIELEGDDTAMIGIPYELTLNFTDLPEQGISGAVFRIGYDRELFNLDYYSNIEFDYDSSDENHPLNYWTISSNPEQGVIMLEDGSAENPITNNGELKLRLRFNVNDNNVAFDSVFDSFAFTVDDVDGSSPNPDGIYDVTINAPISHKTILLLCGIIVDYEAGLDMFDFHGNEVITGIPYITTVDGNHHITTVSDALEMFVQRDSLKIFDADGAAEKAPDDYIGTGAIIKLFHNDRVIYEAVLVIRGELDGNGVIDSTDLYIHRRHLLKYELIDSNTLMWLAGDFDGSGAIKINDLTSILRQSKKATD